MVCARYMCGDMRGHARSRCTGIGGLKGQGRGLSGRSPFLHEKLSATLAIAGGGGGGGSNILQGFEEGGRAREDGFVWLGVVIGEFWTTLTSLPYFRGFLNLFEGPKLPNKVKVKTENKHKR